jgi:hypothetical protein
MQALEELATAWEAKAKHWKRVAAQQRGSRCHDDKARLIMKSELAAGHARELRVAMGLVQAAEAESQRASAALVAAVDADAKRRAPRSARYKAAAMDSEGVQAESDVAPAAQSDAST